MKQPTDQHRYWTFAADPQRYRIIDAVSDLETDTWTTRGKQIRPGDHAVVWQLLDQQGRRGIVALAEVISGPEMQHDADNPYWVNPEDEDKTTVKGRVGVRYIKIAEPLWIDGPQRELVAALSVARARGGTVFKVTPGEWDAILSATGATVEQDTAIIEQDIAELKQRKNLSPREKEALIQARRGQGTFRRDLMNYWVAALLSAAPRRPFCEPLISSPGANHPTKSGLMPQTAC